MNFYHHAKVNFSSICNQMGEISAKSFNKCKNLHICANGQNFHASEKHDHMGFLLSFEKAFDTPRMNFLHQDNMSVQ